MIQKSRAANFDGERERTKGQKLKDYNKLLEEYETEFEIVDKRHKALVWYIERLHGMIENVGG